MKMHSNFRKQNGFSILDVVIGIFIFLVGMLALAALQGALTRSMADSKLRTTAVKLADRAIERQRGFTQLLTAATPGAPFAYNDIVTPGADLAIPRNGVTYTVDMNVSDYYYQLASDTFTTTNTLGVSSSDYKQVDITVTWDSVQDFRGGEGDEIDSGDLNTGSVTLTSTIPAVITSASGRVSDESDGGELNHEVTYSPGANPDVVALNLGGSKFKESLLPEPDVIRSDELVQTTFDVITYSQSNGSTFLRREEFAAVSCECSLRAASADNEARRPVIWAGDEYAAGQFVVKPYGVSANNKNSSLCDSCCRDHHDGGSKQTGDSDDPYANVVGPFKADGEYLGSARETDHRHYKTDGETLASSGDEYLEACRLVRVDGFWRVAQDFRREDQFVFPEDFLDGFNTDDSDTYSDYVTSASYAYTTAATGNDDYPTSSTPCIGLSDLCDPTLREATPNMQGAYSAPIASDELPSWTELETDGTEEQQLRSRGVYVDYMSSDLRLFMDECFSNDDPPVLDTQCCVKNGSAVTSGCSADDLFIDKTPSANLLEVIPFYEVQLTKLENWNQTVQATLPIDLTNEALEDANAHSRGEITQQSVGVTDVTSMSHRGNIAFTNTLPIDPVFEQADASLNVHSLDASGSGGGGGGTDPTVVAGTFTESVQGSPKIDVVGSSDDIVCTLTNKGYTCSVADGATSGSVTVFGYEDVKFGVLRYACSGSLVRTQSQSSVGNTNATFDLFSSGSVLPAGTTYDITITTTDCP